MSKPVCVIKFGGSVLTDEPACSTAVHEVYSAYRQGYDVVAVCSAFKGETDDLTRLAERISENALPSAFSALLRTGEVRSAACLAIACDAAGLPTTLLEPDQFALSTVGPLHDASPVSIDAAAFDRAFERYAVVVVPGFYGRDADGSISLLGRGGSDLTALFLARQLDAADCRLVKDVHGWFDAVNAEGDGAPSNATRSFYRTLNLPEATRRCDKVVQPKAVLFAAQNRTTFRLGRPLSNEHTTISDVASTVSLPNDRRRLRVALLGAGTVGAGVWRHLLRVADRFEIVAGVVHNTEAERPHWVNRDLLFDHLADAPAHDVLIEALPGARVAHPHVEAALEQGIAVITANKDLVARYGSALQDSASRTGAPFRYSASVGGACAILEFADRLTRAGDAVVRVRAVLNATTNVILDGVRSGLTFDEAVADAQRRGFAEADPSTDLSGTDAANKLAIVYHRLTGSWLDPDEVTRQPLDADTVTHAAHSARHIAELRLFDGAERPLAARVTLEELGDDDPLSRLTGVWNGALFEMASGATWFVSGRGAGRWPTSESVMADLLDVHRELTFAPDPIVS